MSGIVVGEFFHRTLSAKESPPPCAFGLVFRLPVSHPAFGQIVRDEFLAVRRTRALGKADADGQRRFVVAGNVLLTFVSHEPASMLKRFTSETLRPLPASHAS
jgi:hypothetical protein